jgi:hypothetical protein
MSGTSAGAKALETGSEIERKDEFEGSKEDSEGGSTTISPAALVALQTINDSLIATCLVFALAVRRGPGSMGITANR